MECVKENSIVKISLNDDELIVFFDWLVRFNGSENDAFFEDDSEKRVLWDLESLLEKNHDSVFKNNYRELLLEARCNIKNREF